MLTQTMMRNFFAVVDVLADPEQAKKQLQEYMDHAKALEDREKALAPKEVRANSIINEEKQKQEQLQRKMKEVDDLKVKMEGMIKDNQKMKVDLEIQQKAVGEMALTLRGKAEKLDQEWKVLEDRKSEINRKEVMLKAQIAEHEAVVKAHNDRVAKLKALV